MPSFGLGVPSFSSLLVKAVVRRASLPFTIPAAVGVPVAAGVPPAVGVPASAGVPAAAGVSAAAGVPANAGVPSAAGVPAAASVLALARARAVQQWQHIFLLRAPTAACFLAFVKANKSKNKWIRCK